MNNENSLFEIRVGHVLHYRTQIPEGVFTPFGKIGSLVEAQRLLERAGSYDPSSFIEMLLMEIILSNRKRYDETRKLVGKEIVVVDTIRRGVLTIEKRNRKLTRKVSVLLNFINENMGEYPSNKEEKNRIKSLALDRFTPNLSGLDISIDTLREHYLR